jgi:NADH-quinone oxidoreductase subunit G
MPRAFVGLNVKEGARMGVKSGEVINVIVGGSTYELELSLRTDIPSGVAVLPAGIPPLEGLALPARGKLSPVAAIQGVETK